MASQEITVNEKNKNILFQFSVLVQCFLPPRAIKEGFYQTNNGNTSLAIESGYLIDPKNIHKYEKREIPAGSKARIIMAYINDQAVRTKNPNINLGKSLNAFMNRVGIKAGGDNYKETLRQVKNILAAKILVGVWDPGVSAVQKNIRIAANSNSWIENESKYGTFWEESITLSPEYMEIVSKSAVPIDFDSLIKLHKNPRAMDIYMWLSYRLRKVAYPKEGISWKILKEIFGQDLKGEYAMKNFKQTFKRSVDEALKYYPNAKIEFHENEVDFYFTEAPIEPKLIK